MQNDAAKHQRYDFEFELTFLLLLLIWQMKVRKSKNTMLLKTFGLVQTSINLQFTADSKLTSLNSDIFSYL